MRAMRIVRNPQDKKPRSNFLAMVMRKNWIPLLFMITVLVNLAKVIRNSASIVPPRFKVEGV
jgi:hypothetical protein